MNFSFNNLANTSFSNNSAQHLRPYEIYPVNLTKIEKTELKGSKDPNASYPVVALEFTGTGDNKGIFSENIFIPTKDEDFERRENPNSHKLMTSSFDQFQFTLMQIVEAINPAGAQKIKEKLSKLSAKNVREFADKCVPVFIDAVIKVLDGKNNVEVYLKLVGRNNNGTVYARLPNACLIGRSGNPEPLNFISADSSKLYFSNYEIGQMKAYKDAKPTKMEDVENPDTQEGSDLDLDGIDDIL